MRLKMKFNSLKRAAYVFAFIVLPLLSFGNDQADALFAKANASYAKAQYKDALLTYQKILSGGDESAAVYFNMGNASYKLDDIPSALLYYEKAHKLSPADEDIKVNIRLANLKTSDKMEEVPEFFLRRWWNSFIFSFSATTFSVISILLILAGSAFLLVYFFSLSPAVKRASFYTAITLFVLGLFTVFIAGRQVSFLENNREAIVFSSVISVKSAPEESSKVLFVIHEGIKVTLLENSSSWIKIRLANGNEGWIRQADIKEI